MANLEQSCFDGHGIVSPLCTERGNVFSIEDTLISCVKKRFAKEWCS
jgi:hypothetical protein